MILTEFILVSHFVKTTYGIKTIFFYFVPLGLVKVTHLHCIVFECDDASQKLHFLWDHIQRWKYLWGFVIFRSQNKTNLALN